MMGKILSKRRRIWILLAIFWAAAACLAPLLTLLATAAGAAAFGCYKITCRLKDMAWGKILLAMCWCLWFLTTSVGIGLYWGYTILCDEEILKDLAVKEIKKYLKPEVAAHLKPPAHIKAILPERKVVVEELRIPDSFGNTLASVKRVEIFFEEIFPEVRVGAVLVEEPEVFLRRDEEGRPNFLIFTEAKVEPAEPFKIPEISLKDGTISIQCEGIIERPFLLREVECNVIPEGESNYRLTGSLTPESAQKVSISGTYLPECGFCLNCSPFTFSLKSLPERFSLPFYLKAGGKVSLSEIALTGLTSAGLNWQGKVMLTEGSLYWKGSKIGLSKMEASLKVHNEEFSAIYLSVRAGETEIKIENGCASNARVHLPFQATNFHLKDSMARVLPTLNLVSTEEWDMVKPRGVMNATGIITRSAEGQWGVESRLHLTQGSFNYRNLQCQNVAIILVYRPPYQIGVEGQWNLRGGDFRIEPGCTVDLSGPLPIIHGLCLSFENFHLTPDIWKEFPEGDEIWQLLKPEGFIAGRISWDGPLSLENLSAELKLKDFKTVCAEMPHPAENVSATLSLKKCVLHIEVHGHISNNIGAVIVTGTVWPFEIHPKTSKIRAAFDLTIEVRDALLTGQLYQAFDTQWREDIREVWDVLDFAKEQGRLHVTVHISMRPESPEYEVCIAHYEVLVGGEDLLSRCVYFPYRVTEVTGEVKAEQGRAIVFSGIKAKKEGGEFSISGELMPTSKGLEVRYLTVKGKNVALDDDLKKALGKEAAIWEELALGGIADIEVNLNKIPAQEVQWHATAILKDASACYGGFPYRVEGLTGVVHLKPNHFVLEEVRGAARGGRVTLNGWIAPPCFDLTISAADIPLDKKLRKALRKLSPDITEICEQFCLKGLLSGEIHLKREDSMPLEWQVLLKFENLRGYYTGFPYSLSHLKGSVSITPQGFDIHSCEGKCGTGEICLTGRQTVEKELFLNISGQNVELNSKLYEALSEEERKIWDQFQPQGRTDLKLSLHINAERSEYELCLFPRDCSVFYEKFPYRVDDLAADEGSGIVVRGFSRSDKREKNFNVVFKRLYGRHGTGIFEVAGSFYPFATEEQSRLELHIAAQNIPVDRELRHALSQFFPQIMKSLAPRGSIAEFRMGLEHHDGPQKYMRYQVAIKGMRVAIKKDKFLEEVAGDVVLEGFGYDERHHAKGYVQDGEVVLNGLRITQVKAPIKFFNDYLQFSPIEGSFYEGTAHGWFLLDTSEYGSFQGVCTVSNANLNPVVKDLMEHSDKKEEKNSEEGAKGTLFGEISFQGNHHRNDLLTGRGWIEVRNGEIWRLPLLLAIFDILSLPDRPAFREGEVRFSISKGHLEINMLRLHSSLLSISGNGTVDFEGNLKLRLLTHFAPQYLPRIPLVNHMLDILKQEFFELYVSGTLSQPYIVLPQWETIRDIIK